MGKDINNIFITKKKFLQKKEINILMNDIYKVFIKKKNLTKKFSKINFLQNRSEFDKLYFDIKEKTNYWPKIYDNLDRVPSYKKIILKKISIFIKKKFNKKIKIITKKFRVIEKNDKRSYPMHQEYPGIKSKSFLIFWVALHKIKKSEGGLRLSKLKDNVPLIHKKNRMGYPILINQPKIKKNSFEKTFQPGELLILGKYISHGTAKKLKGQPRWASLVRAKIIEN